jgi:hypothetical protein
MIKKMMAAALLAAVLSGSAHAGFVINVAQVGSDVVSTGSGSIDFLALNFIAFQNPTPSVDASTNTLILGAVPPPTYDEYQLISPSTPNFGTGGLSLASSGSGDPIGVSGDTLYLPGGYPLNGPLSNTNTWSNTTIAALGLTPGSYTWTWGAGTDDPDSLTLNIAGSSVPEPSSLAMAGIAVTAGLLVARRRRRR